MYYLIDAAFLVSVWPGMMEQEHCNLLYTRYFGRIFVELNYYFRKKEFIYMTPKIHLSL
jgi:hypothetical protein